MDIPARDAPGPVEASSIGSSLARNSLLDPSSSTDSLVAFGSGSQNDAESDTAIAQAAKAIEAAENRESTRGTQSGTSSPDSSYRPRSVATSSGWNEGAEEQRLLHEADSAPPNYADIAGTRLLYPAQETDRLQSGQHADEDEDDLYAGSIHTPRRPWHKHLLKRYGKRLCLVNLAIYCAIATAIICFQATRRRNTQAEWSVFPLDHPLHDNNWLKPEKFHPNTPECEFDYFDDYRWFGYRDPVDFSFVEEPYPYTDNASRTVHVFGNVDIRPAPYTQVDPIEIATTIATSRLGRGTWPIFEHGQNGLRLHYPPAEGEITDVGPDHDGLKRRNAESSCIHVWVGIHVKTSPANWTTHTENLDIDIGMSRPFREEAVFTLPIRQDTIISSRVGQIVIHKLDSRRANVSTEHGSIKGAFRLNDELNLETVDGDIDVEVEQVPAYENRYLDSHPSNTPANFTTQTGSGHQRIYLDSGWDGLYGGDQLGYGYVYLLKSQHSSQSGKIAYISGDFWEGTMSAKSLNGSISLGDDMWETVSENTDDMSIGKSPRQVRARKGTMPSTLELESQQGDIDVCIGDPLDCPMPWLFERPKEFAN